MVKSYTLEQVTEHNTEESCWLVVNYNVYDVTSFLNEHPGGKQILLNNAGQDVTEKIKLIEAHLEAPNFKEYLSTFLVGVLIL